MTDQFSEPTSTEISGPIVADLSEPDSAPVELPAPAAVVHASNNTAETFQVSGGAFRTAAVAFVFLIIGLAGGVMLMSGRGVSTEDIERIARAVAAEEIANAGGFSGAASSTSLIDDDPSFGMADAPITIVEFSDFYCTYCTRFANETLPLIREQYGEHIRFVYRDLPIIGGQVSIDAAVAGNCAHDQGKFWEFHDILFANNAAQSRERFVSFASELGMDADAFTLCLDDQAQIDEVMLDFVDGQTLGIQGTPKFYINGKVISGAQPFDTFALVIDAELKKAGITPPAREAETTPEPEA